MGIQKECVICGDTFTTRTNFSLSINRCDACHSDTKQNKILGLYTTNLENQVVSLEDRVLRLESMLDTALDSIIRTEVTAQLNQAPPVLDAVEELKNNFETKLMSLNNKIVNMTDGHIFNKKKKKVKK